MYPSEFDRKLQKLNKGLRVDRERIAYPYSKEYGMCGLYYDQKYLFGIPQKWQPEYTIMGADMKLLIEEQKVHIVQYMLEHGYIPEGEVVTEKILWRGWRKILSELVRLGYINRDQTEKEFNITLYPKKIEYPRVYIQFDER